MSYLVLARKWRPKRFAELVGQEHVVRALTNALESGRVHHAFLFTGTRGVGKTTIARIFSKSLNCERGQSSDPCGECNSCLDIDAGRFVDLLEIDAASNTGVDDVRELIENAQYMPARGRIKVYLIDEVHMLSKAAFNALLKTLEEPPEHVKFLLATTDPQKLPVTVLSRCLQFNLRRLEQQQIHAQMEKILRAENIGFDSGALNLLARGADGSLRDGLSLLDQAIAYTGGQLNEAAVVAMLGTVDRTLIGELLEALAAGDGAALMQGIERLASFSPEYSGVLDDLAAALHSVQVKQLVPNAEVFADKVNVDALAQQLPAELVQLWYQMAVSGRRDLPFAPSPRSGFEMTVLRMLAFRPSSEAEPALIKTATATPAKSTVKTVPAAAPSSADYSAAPVSVSVSKPASNDALAESVTVSTSSKSIAKNFADNEEWLRWVSAAGFKGPALAFASHTSFVSHADNVLRLGLSDDDSHLKNDSTVRSLSQALSASFGSEQKVVVETMRAGADTFQARQDRQRAERQSGAQSEFMSHPAVMNIVKDGGVINADSIRPFKEN